MPSDGPEDAEELEADGPEDAGDSEQANEPEDAGDSEQGAGRESADGDEPVVLRETDAGLVLIDGDGEEWVLPDGDGETWVVLDDTGEEWVVLDEATEQRVTVDEAEGGWVLRGEDGEEYATLDVEQLGDIADPETGQISRRGAMQLAAGGILTASLFAGVDAGALGGAGRPEGQDPETALADVEFDYPTALDLPFAHGVASGDPLPERVIIWTRLTYEDPPEQIDVEYEVGTDPALTDIVTTGTITTGPDRDWTVKADASGLEPGTTYYYRFFTDEASSITGRTRTAPRGDVSELRLGVAACTSYWSGQFNGYGRLADRNSLDLIVHVGDYIYDFPDPQEYVRARHDIFDEEYVDFRRWETIDEVRRRYALYYSDPDQVRAHQQHPFSIMWDNHEVSPNGDVTAEQARRVFWEWTPSRPVKPDGSGDPLGPTDDYPEPEDPKYLYRRLPYGDLADLLLMDHEQWSEQPSPDSLEQYRSLLGAEQFEWVTESMTDSAEAGTTWRVLGNPLYIGPMRVYNLPEEVPLLDRDGVQSDLVYNSRQWDGYPLERERFCELLREEGVEDNLFLTGDMHMNWCSDVTENPAQGLYDPGDGTGEHHSVGVEFAPTSISRGGADETIWGAINGFLPSDVAERVSVGISRIVERKLSAVNRNVQFMEWTEHGYGVVHLTEEAATLEYWWTPLTPRSPQQRLGAQLRVPRSSDESRNHAEQVGEPEPTTGRRTDAPAPYPEGLDGF